MAAPNPAAPRPTCVQCACIAQGWVGGPANATTELLSAGRWSLTGGRALEVPSDSLAWITYRMQSVLPVGCYLAHSLEELAAMTTPVTDANAFRAAAHTKPRAKVNEQ